jgi:general secretion pathway protein E
VFGVPVAQDLGQFRTLEQAVPAPLDGRNPAFIQAFLESLVTSGRLDRGASDRAAQAQVQTGQRIDVVLSQLGLIAEPAMLDALSQLASIPLVTPDPAGTLDVNERLSADYLKRHRLLPVAETPAQLTIAADHPFNQDVLSGLAFLLDKPVTQVLMASRDIDAGFLRLYGSDTPAAADSQDGGDDSATVYEDDVQHLRDLASEAPIIRLVNRLIATAVSRHASDIHIEAMGDSLKVRYRIDGDMEEVERLPPDLHAGVASRIKILGKLNIAERRLPQDGRTKFVVGGREIDLRLSTAPALHGESIVMRILDKDRVDLSFEPLGFDPVIIETMLQLLAKPNGIFLVTGPTGSGKTTTLYAALTVLNSATRKVFSVEDPIEYQLAGINQMQIKPTIGLDFVNCLRAILRQDPDIIMIGEMRDTETARIGVQASLTGHLVLSTLHTNSAPASITRLLDMGVEDYLLASTLNGVLAQRLVRKLCSCATPLIDQALADRLRNELGRRFDHTVQMRQPHGCPECRQTGFRGRTTIAELLVINDELRQQITKGITDRSIEAIGRAHGMETLYQNGLRKVLAGETTLNDVLRVASQ